ncbi:hypothetical protein RDT67_26070 [Serratia fonticola]|uniref:Uncharacterized protein n=1 Tax=Serratia fonticola TaxID=47917 RepID=A0AAJ2DC48_SERFO|nr:hypothetical protein [Serratia fonticola]MDQ9129879.1 hypothetical protein [Serratia fonticola]
MEQPVSSGCTLACETEIQATCRSHENLFCQIDADSLNVHDGRSAQVVTIYRPTVAQEMGGDHSINKAGF